MKLAFRPLPGIRDATPRPIVVTFVAGLEETGVACLLDTGSLHNRFAGWVGREAGVDLHPVEPESLGVGGRPVIARTAVVGLRVGDHNWEAPVSFCDPWPWDFNILGQEGFFRWFRVVFEAASRSIEITPQA